MVVVTRWYGGIHLGADRFKDINTVNLTFGAGHVDGELIWRHILSLRRSHETHYKLVDSWKRCMKVGKRARVAAGRKEGARRNDEQLAHCGKGVSNETRDGFCVSKRCHDSLSVGEQ